MSEITQIRLPDGEIVWARVSGQTGARDTVFTDRVGALAAGELTKLAGAVVGTVREAVSEHHADEVSIDFGIEFSLKSGKVVGVLAEVGSTSSIVVHLTWRGESAGPTAAG